MSEINVSVIVPVFNAENYLYECLDSIRNQTLKNIEIICVDDDSADSSRRILEEYKIIDPRFIILRQKHKGAGAARNLGMSIAKGKYVCFLDSDDIFEKDMLLKMYSRAELLNLDVVVCRADRFEHDLLNRVSCDWTIRDYLLPTKTVFSSQDIKKDFFVAFVWWPWDKLYKREHVHKAHLRFQEIRTTNDLYFVCGAVLLASRISYIDDILVHQRIGVKTSLSVTREKSWDCFFIALIELRKLLREHLLYKRFEQDFINYCLSFSLWHLTTLSGQSYCKLYEKLHNQWYESLDVASKTADYFYNPDEYKMLQNILSQDLISHLLWRIQETNAENSKLRDQKDKIDTELTFLRNSRTYKIGLLITYIPRNLKKVIINIHRSGFSNTMRKIRSKLMKG